MDFLLAWSFKPFTMLYFFVFIPLGYKIELLGSSTASSAFKSIPWVGVSRIYSIVSGILYYGGD